MRIRILVFGVLKDVISEASPTLELPDGACVLDVLDHYRQGCRESKVWDTLAVAVNREYVSAGYVLRDGDEVALLPPVSGGNVGAGSVGMVALTHERIDAERLVANLKTGEDGAVVMFDGIVRNNTRGRRTLYLDYEAYEEMALAQMRELAAKAAADFKIRDVAIVHRLGRLEIGETSVLIAVASTHRAAAFDACRWLIDTLKKTVPVWKKEHFENGAVWADGEKWSHE